MAESRVIIRCPSSSSPPPNCAICLGTFSNKCFSDTCLHQFCFKCLLEWSKIKAECPLCKQPFTRILHNIKSNNEYDEHVVEIRPTEEINLINDLNEYNPFLPNVGVLPSTRHHFHFRTTFTVDTHGEHAIQQMLLTHPQISVSTGGYTPRNNIFRRRREMAATTTNFRRSIYLRNLWAICPPDAYGRYRECTPEFFTEAPIARTRLVPWLNRELNALLYENTQLVMRLVDIILDHLLRHHICSRTFRTLLYEYLNNKTDHFVHEFYNFMRSPFDMIGYDRHVIYSERPQSPAFVVTLQDDVSDSGHDSDVIIVGASLPPEPVVIDLVNTDSDEPIVISHEEPPPPELIPIPDNSPEPAARESRTPVLPLKLRLKHKRRSREEERYRRRSKRYRSSSSSSSSDSSVRRSLERYKRKRKLKKQKRRVMSSTESIVTTSSSDSYDNTTYTFQKLKKLKKKKSITPHRKRSSRLSTIRDRSGRNVATSSDFQNLPSCSRDSGPSIGDLNTDNLLDLRTNIKREPAAPVDLEAPSCSKFTAPNRYEVSSDDEYLPKFGMKKEVKTEPNETVPKTSERIRNIMIKKENSGNSWYTYQCDYDSSDIEP